MHCLDLRDEHEFLNVKKENYLFQPHLGLHGLQNACRVPFIVFYGSESMILRLGDLKPPVCCSSLTLFHFRSKGLH